MGTVGAAMEEKLLSMMLHRMAIAPKSHHLWKSADPDVFVSQYLEKG